MRGSAGIGRRARLRTACLKGVGVRVPPSPPLGRGFYNSYELNKVRRIEMVNKNVETAGEKSPEQLPKILTKPLPKILDEIDDSIKLADEAAKDAREAADEARKAGEKAASEAARVATESIARVEQLAETIKLAVLEAAAALDKRLSGKP